MSRKSLAVFQSDSWISNSSYVTNSHGGKIQDLSISKHETTIVWQGFRVVHEFRMIHAHMNMPIHSDNALIGLTGVQTILSRVVECDGGEMSNFNKYTIPIRTYPFIQTRTCLWGGLASNDLQVSRSTDIPIEHCDKSACLKYKQH